MDRAEVRNAADPAQVKRARRKEDRVAEDRLAFYREGLATYAGRALLRDLLEMAGVYRSVWSLDSGSIYYNSGRQDFGHELQAMLLRADDVNYLQMEHEAHARAKRDAATTDAGHTPVASQGDLS